MNRRALVTFTLGVAFATAPAASAEQLGKLGGALKRANQVRDVQMTDAEEAQLGGEVSQRIRALEREVGQVLLRRGEVLAAVTTEPQPVQGCAAEPLGSMRYVPLASPALLARHAAGDVVDLGAMPMMRYNAKDDLQRLALSGAGLDVAPPTHLAPSFDGFHRSVRAGLGWGMLVDAQAVEDVRAGRLVRVPGLDDVLVPLYWQAATLPVTRLVRLTRAVREADQRTLERG